MYVLTCKLSFGLLAESFNELYMPNTFLLVKVIRKVIRWIYHPGNFSFVNYLDLFGDYFFSLVNRI